MTRVEAIIKKNDGLRINQPQIVIDNEVRIDFHNQDTLRQLNEAELISIPNLTVDKAAMGLTKLIDEDEKRDVAYRMIDICSIVERSISNTYDMLNLIELPLDIGINTIDCEIDLYHSIDKASRECHSIVTGLRQHYNIFETETITKNKEL